MIMYDYPVKFTTTNNYGNCPDDDVYTVEEFIECCNDGAFIDSDGSGYPVKDTLADRSISIYPSNLKKIPNDATHIVWYNK